jgi:hypothetical protein
MNNKFLLMSPSRQFPMDYLILGQWPLSSKFFPINNSLAINLFYTLCNLSCWQRGKTDCDN